MDWTEGTVGDQPIGPTFHVPHSSSKSDFLSGASANKKKTTDKSTMTITDPIPPPPPLPTPPCPPPPSTPPPPGPHYSQSNPSPLPTLSNNPPFQIKAKKSLDCEVCKKHFTRTNDLRDHKINVHKMGNPYICLTCFKTYSNKRNLNQHIKNKHQNANKFTCFKTQKSGKRYKLQTDSKNVYQTHNVTYHGEQPSGDFSCTKCNKTLLVKVFCQNILSMQCVTE